MKLPIFADPKIKKPFRVLAINQLSLGWVGSFSRKPKGLFYCPWFIGLVAGQWRESTAFGCPVEPLQRERHCNSGKQAAKPEPVCRKSGVSWRLRQACKGIALGRLCLAHQQACT